MANRQIARFGRAVCYYLLFGETGKEHASAVRPVIQTVIRRAKNLTLILPLNSGAKFFFVHRAWG